MEDVKTRLLDERHQLGERMNKLSSFMLTGAFPEIKPIQASILKIQLEAMNTYYICLSERVKSL